MTRFFGCLVLVAFLGREASGGMIYGDAGDGTVDVSDVSGVPGTAGDDVRTMWTNPDS